MSREILFKAKVKDWKQKPKDEQWVYGYYVLGFNVYEEPIHIIFEPTTVFKENGGTDGWEKIDIDTICQYTGLTDKNGNKIWENDVVLLDDEYWLVKWSDNDAQFTIEDDCTIEHFGNVWGADCEVYGNSFDDPELLKGE